MHLRAEPRTSTLVVLANDDNVRFRFFFDDEGDVTGFRLVYKDGYEGTVFPKTDEL